MKEDAVTKMSWLKKLQVSFALPFLASMLIVLFAAVFSIAGLLIVLVTWVPFFSILANLLVGLLALFGLNLVPETSTLITVSSWLFAVLIGLSAIQFVFYLFNRDASKPIVLASSPIIILGLIYLPLAASAVSTMEAHAWLKHPIHNVSFWNSVGNHERCAEEFIESELEYDVASVSLDLPDNLDASFSCFGEATLQDGRHFAFSYTRRPEGYYFVNPIAPPHHH